MSAATPFSAMKVLRRSCCSARSPVSCWQASKTGVSLAVTAAPPDMEAFGTTGRKAPTNLRICTAKSVSQGKGKGDLPQSSRTSNEDKTTMTKQ